MKFENSKLSWQQRRSLSWYNWWSTKDLRKRKNEKRVKMKFRISPITSLRLQTFWNSIKNNYCDRVTFCDWCFYYRKNFTYTYLPWSANLFESLFILKITRIFLMKVWRNFSEVNLTRRSNTNAHLSLASPVTL